MKSTGQKWQVGRRERNTLSRYVCHRSRFPVTELPQCLADNAVTVRYAADMPLMYRAKHERQGNMKENAPNPSRFAAYLSPSSVMQSLEKPVLNLEPPKTVCSTLTQENPARRLAVVALPLALLAAWCLASLGERTVQCLLHPAEIQDRAQSKAQAQTVAASVLRGIGDTPLAANELQFSTQTAFSVRRNTAIHEWNVVADSGENKQYLLRINAHTKVVYGINRVSSSPLAIARPAQNVAVSPEEARRLAGHYLQSIAGGDKNPLLVWENTGFVNTDSSAVDSDGNSYIFTCHRSKAGGNKRLIKIGVDRQTGDLSYYWNPSGVR